MEISRSIILDLLPLYLAGEGSPETRALVGEYLRRDPELAAQVRALSAEGAPGISGAGLQGVGPGPSAEVELRAFRRTKRVLGLLRLLFGLALTFSLLPLSFELTTDRGRVTEFHFLLRDHPTQFIGMLAVGLTCWAAYFTMRRRLRTHVT